MKATSGHLSRLSRRKFLKTGGLSAAGLVVAFHLPACARRDESAINNATEQSWVPNAFVRMTADGAITVLVNHQEMGQGVYTALPMLVAEEMDADWQRIRVELAPVLPEYHHAAYKIRLTGGSTSVPSSWQSLRTVGAMVRTLLVNAAAELWGVESTALQTRDSQVIHPASGRQAPYGSLIEIATTLATPEEVTLKDPRDFVLIGTPVKRLEGPDKVTGKARFSLDFRLPEMLTAVVAHPPVFGDKVKSYKAEKSLAHPGVVKVKPISTGVAVIARDFWTARTARDLLTIEWEAGPATGFSAARQQQAYRELAQQPGSVAENTGDVEAALKGADQVTEALYEVPYLAHACMEPLSCTARVEANACELWLGTQAQTFDQNNVAKVLGIRPEQVKVNGLLMGGGFGRRAGREVDYVSDAVEVAKDEGVPVKTIWTREEDIQGGYYRPMFTHKVMAGLDKTGMPVAWWQRLVGQSISINTPFEQSIRDGIDYANLGGATGSPYAMANRRIELQGPASPIPVHWWRAICYTQNTFVRESFIDELAFAGGQDPLTFRQKLLADHPRHLQVLAMVAEKAEWGKALPKGHGQGMAIEHCMGTYVAQVAEVAVTDDNEIQVQRVTTVVDCGIAVNPLNIKAQIEGAIVFGLSATLYGEITIEEGKIQQSNFHDYPVLRMDAMPAIEVHIVKSVEPPSGIGEPGVPPVAPAVANAVFAATGKRVRKLPIRL